MYHRYFGLRQPPFKITPDTRLFFPGGNRGAVLEALVYAVTHGEGIVKVVGEVGSGKTMLCRMLELELPEQVEIIYLANPNLSPDNILHAIAFELRLPVEVSDNRIKVMQQLQEYLLRRHTENKQVVMFVEEAQGMPLETLEEIRLLSNLETQQDKLLQIVLFGQPELDQNLSGENIRQLKERITYSFDLGPFKAEQIRDYINTRLRACGHKNNEIFTRAALREIERYSQGLLRRVNILADKAMLAAYADNTSTIKPKHVRTAARDSDFRGRRRWWPVALGAAALLLVLAGAGLWYQGERGEVASTGSALAADAETVGGDPAVPARGAVPDQARPGPRENPAGPVTKQAGVGVPVSGRETVTTRRAAERPAQPAVPGLLGNDILKPELEPMLTGETLPYLVSIQKHPLPQGEGEGKRQISTR